MEKQEIYEPFTVAAALGVKLKAPPHTYVYLIRGESEREEEKFVGIYNDLEMGIKEFASHALEQLELLDSLAPWNTISDEERSKVSILEYLEKFNTSMLAWEIGKNDLEIIEAFYGENYTIEEKEIL